MYNRWFFKQIRQRSHYGIKHNKLIKILHFCTICICINLLAPNVFQSCRYTLYFFYFLAESEFRNFGILIPLYFQFKFQRNIWAILKYPTKKNPKLEALTSIKSKFWTRNKYQTKKLRPFNYMNFEHLFK